jgi:cytochrome P450
MAVTHDTATFSSRVTNLFDVRPKRLLEMPPITIDPPEHTSYRHLLLPMFTPSAVERLAPQVEALCHRLIDAFIETGHADAGVDYAQHVPVLMTARLLGLPDSDADRFRAWIHDMIERGQSEPEVGAQAIRELLSYFREQLAHRNDHPSDDVTSLVANAEVNGEPVDERTKAAMLLLMLIGGVDTTWPALGASLWHLATHPRIRRGYASNPSSLTPRSRSSSGSTRPWRSAASLLATPCSAAAPSPKETKFGFPSRPPTETRLSSPTPNGSSSIANPTATSLSVSVSTAVSARTSPGWK